MIIRFLSLLFVVSALGAQQSSISFEIITNDFPKDCVFKVDLSLRYVAADRKTNQGSMLITEKDYLLNQVSNSCNWTVSYENDGKPRFVGSPQSAVFTFPKPINQLSNAVALIRLEGNVTFLRDKKIIRDVAVDYIQDFQPNESYLLQLKFNEVTKDDRVLWGMLFLTKKQLQEGILDGIIIDNKGVKTTIQPITYDPKRK